ncbi:hypothetical protein BCR44DRAFT_1487365 [Catenaria anguillulae PL171]|uniref:Uncharacterized protein n=1 Tax=Catenaria anguillulae PL171 TaxID=765915 RepID=A0A1Y2HEQ8_9FUNG|nr:hypothetical protein BCR44DRAFT_1487365 [Catenaria anguillulae PL171]
MTQDSTFTATSIPWSIPLPQSPSSSFASSHPAQRDASSAAPVWIRNEPVIVHDTTLDMAAQLPLPMSRGGSFSHSLPSSSSTRDWTRFAQQVRLPPSSSNFATMLQDASVDLPLLQFDQGHQVPLPSSTSLLAPAMLPPLPASTSMLTPAHDVPSITLQATPVLHPPSSSSSNTFVDSGSFSSTHSAPMLAAHFPILPPSSSSLASGPSHGASSIPLPPSRSTLATLQPHTIALPPSSSHLHGQRDDGLQSANVPLPPSTSATAPSPGRSLEPAAMALPAAASDQPTANNRRDATEQDVDTWASKSGHRSSKPMLNDQVLVALRLSDPDLLSSPNSDKPPQVQSPTTHESIEQGDSSTSTAHCMPLPPSQSHLVSKSNHSSASLTRLPKSGSLTPRESSAPSRRLSQLTTSTHSLSPSSSGSVTPTDASSSVHLYRSDRSRSASSSSRALSLIEIFDIFFIYASVTSSTPVKYRQDRLLSLLRAKLGPTRMLLADITLPEFHKLRAQAIEHVKAKGFKVPPWPVVVLQVRVVEGNASGASLAFKEEVDPTDAGEVRAAWTAGDEEAGGGCERTWIAHEEIEEAMEMGTLDELLQLEHEDEVEVEGTQDDGELDEEKESDVREKDESE